MKKIHLMALIGIILFIFCQIAAHAEDNRYGELTKVRATYYLPTGNSCADGTTPIEGLTIAGPSSWMGKTIIMYDMDMHLIGIYEVRDTGGHEGIISGARVDIFFDSDDAGRTFVKTYGDYVMIQLIEAAG